MEAYISNQLEVLYEALREQVPQDPFTPFFVLVPDQAMKMWLLFRMVQDESKVLFGDSFFVLKEGLQCVLERDQGKEAIPKSIHSGFFCIKNLSSVLEMVLRVHTIEDALQLYIKKEWILFSQEVVTRFDEALYGNFVRSTKSTLDVVIEKCIEELLFRYRASQKPISKPELKEPFSVVFFGFVTLPQGYRKLIEDIGKSHRVLYYVLSVSLLYWEDLCSDRKAQKIVEKLAQHSCFDQEKLEELFFERNPFLANVGAEAQDFPLYLEEKMGYLKELYVVPQWALIENERSQYIRQDVLFRIEETKKTLLSCVQNDILLLLGKRTPPLEIDLDETIQVHGAPTRYTELLCLRKAIQAMYSQETIIVLAPDIDLYRPYIERIFPKNLFEYTIVGNEKRNPFGIINTFFLLFQLDEKRWRKSVIEKLFLCPAFNRAAFSDTNYAGEVSNLLKMGGFSWGTTGRQRKKILLEEGTVYFENEVQSGTWKACFEALIERNFSDRDPLLYFDDGLLCAALELFSHIDRLSHAMEERHCSKTVEDWAVFFQKILSDYFVIDPFASDQKELVFLQKAIYSFFQLESTEEISFEEAFFLFSRECEQYEDAPFFYAPIVFGSIGSIQAHPCRLLAFLDMGESKQGEYSQAFYFLEAIMQVKECLWIGYQNYSFEERGKKNLAKEVLFFLESIDSRYRNNQVPVSKKIVQEHPIEWFFVEEKKELPQREMHFSKKNTETDTITIDSMQKIARNPLRAYMENTFGVQFFQEKKKREFGYSYPSRFLLHDMVEKAIQEDCTDFYKSISKELHFGHPFLERVAKKECIHTFNALGSTIAYFGIDWDARSHVIFSKAFSQIEEKGKNTWHVPSLQVTCLGKKMYIEGSFDLIYEDALILFEEKSLRSILRNWPKIILRAVLSELLPIRPLEKLYFLYDAKEEKISLEDPSTHLQVYIEYVERARKEPFFLAPDWVQFLVQNDEVSEEEFYAKQKSLSFTYEDPYEKAFIEEVPFKIISQSLLESRELAKKLFSGMFK